MPRIQSHSRIERPIPSARRPASQGQDFSDALAAKGDKPLLPGCFAPAGGSVGDSSRDFTGGTVSLPKKDAKPEPMIAALGAMDGSGNRNFAVAESPPATNGINVDGPSSWPIDSAALPSGSGVLPASLDVGVGRSMDRLADDVVSPLDAGLPSADGSAEFAAAGAAAADPTILPKIDAAQPLLAEVDVRLGGSAISLTDAHLSPMKDGLEFATMQGVPENDPAMRGVGAVKALFAVSGVDTGESSSQVAGGSAPSSGANPSSAGGTLELPTTNDATASRVGLIEVEDAGVSAKLPLFPNASNALLGLPIASASQSVTWSRVFGQHLIANGYLSVVDVASGERKGSEALGASVDGHEGGLEAGGTSPSISLATDPDQALDAQAVDLPGLLHPVVENGTDGNGFEVSENAPLAALETALASDRRWNKRVLKLTQDPVGACTAWVRDFGLRESEMRTLVALLKRQAALQGVPLGRIVINGREFWRTQG